MEGTNGQPGNVGEWGSSFDPVKAITALDMQEAALSQLRGAHPGGYESQCRVVGAARVISKEGLRRVRLARELSQRMGDQELLSKAAAVQRQSRRTVYPENPHDWQIIYNELEPMA